MVRGYIMDDFKEKDIKKYSENDVLYMINDTGKHLASENTNV